MMREAAVRIAENVATRLEGARELRVTLKREKCVIDWRRQQTRAPVLVTIEEMLDNVFRADAPDTYHERCYRVYQYVFDACAAGRAGIYGSAA